MIELLLALGSSAPSAWSFTDKSAATVITEDGRLASCPTNLDAVRGLKSWTTGTRYFEVQTPYRGQFFVGIGPSNWSFSNYLGFQDANSVSYFSQGIIYSNGGTSTSASLYNTGSNVIGVAVNLTSRLIYFAKNNVWQNGGVGIPYNSTLPMFPAFQSGVFSVDDTEHAARLATDLGDFAYTPPVGYDAWA